MPDKNVLSANGLYATGSDFCRIFKENMNSLYLLSLLLTGDPEKAEHCFVSGLDDCTGGNQVFKEWAQSWARRTIIKNAIRLMAPAPRDVGFQDNGNPAGIYSGTELRAELAVVLSLQPFERFAYVTSVLEGYSDRDSALLLGCTRESLIAARVSALRQITRSMNVLDKQQPAATVNAKPAEEKRGSFFPPIVAPLATTA